MTPREFDKFLSDLSHFYERRQPTDEAKEMWYQKVRNIKSEALPAIIQKITDTSEFFPRNLPSVMWAIYMQGVETSETTGAKPGKKYFECPECNSEGIISLRKRENGYYYSYAFRCARCKQAENKTWLRMARLPMLLQEGYEKHPEKLETQRIGKRGDSSTRYVLKKPDDMNRVGDMLGKFNKQKEQ